MGASQQRDGGRGETDTPVETKNVATDGAAGRAPTIYKLSLALGVVSVFLGGTFGVVSWVAIGLASVALIVEKDDSRRWMAWVGLGLGIVFALMNAYLNGHFDDFASFESSESVTSSAESAAQDPGFGLTPDEFRVRWNEAVEAWSDHCTQDDCDADFSSVRLTGLRSQSEGDWTTFGHEFGANSRLTGFASDGIVDKAWVSVDITPEAGTGSFTELELLLCSTVYVSDDPMSEDQCSEVFEQLGYFEEIPSTPPIEIDRSATVGGVNWTSTVYVGSDLFPDMALLEAASPASEDPRR